jgi:DNA-binding PadR family transcriptional regulator
MKIRLVHTIGFRGGCNNPGERHRDGQHSGHGHRDHGPRGFAGFDEFGDGRRGFRGGRGVPGRMFGAGDLRYVILKLIAEKPRHGYEIIKSIQERLGGGYAPSPGVVYPMLTMLEEMGYATVVTEGARKLYTITDEGSKSLAENKAVVDALFARMDQARGEQVNDRAPQIERAVENFRMALRMKPGPLTTEQIHAITDIIDAAAKQIERA